MVPAVEVINLSYYYRNGVKALDSVSFTVPAGAKIALLGPNGAGKSTLLLHLNGINRVQAGRINLLGQELTPATENWARERVGLVFQDPDDQVFSPTVWQDVAFGPSNLGLPKPEIEKRVTESLKGVGMLEYRDRSPHQLSFGQKKRVAIAGVLAMQPDIIVLDEPTAYLDPFSQKQLMAILNELNSQGKTIIVAIHDVDFAVEWADQVIILQSGRVIADGSSKLLTDIELVQTACLELPTVTRLFRQIPELAGLSLPSRLDEGAALIREIIRRLPSDRLADLLSDDRKSDS